MAMGAKGRAMGAACVAAVVMMGEAGPGGAGAAFASREATAARAADADFDALVSMMVGSFSSAAQAAADAENYMDIRLEMVRIWPERTDGAWLYVEQAAASALERPYRQRVYRVHRTGANEFRSEVYTLPGDALAFAGAHNDAGKLAGLKPESLTLREGCALTLHRSADGSFNGGTSGGGCASDLRGASFAVSEAHIGPEGLRTWDRGYDAKGVQVWGATEGPYRFVRVGR